MMAGRRSRYIWFLSIVLVVVALDQISKVWADGWLAAPKVLPEYPSHPIELLVGPEDEALGLGQLLDSRLVWSRDEEIRDILRRHLLVDGARGPHAYETQLRRGQELRILRRVVVVLEDHWHFRFVRNPAAAWSFLKGLDHRYRRPLFITVSILSIVLIVYLFLRSGPDQRLLVIALALILAGAIGNLVDRVRLGFVIDFIDWFIIVWGRERHWPTFNIADAGITVGVGLLLIEVLRGRPREMAPGASVRK